MAMTRPRRFQFGLLTLLIVLTSTCVLVASALVTGRFCSWMFAPLGIVYAVSTFFPCYFRLVNRITPIRVVRNVLFAVIAFLCLAIAVGTLPTRWIGL